MMKVLILTAAATLAAAAPTGCPSLPIGSGCTVLAPMVSCGVIQCQVNYFGDVFTSTLHMHPCDPEFNFVWGFNRSSTDLNVGYLVNATEGFFVKDLSVTVPPIGASTIFALANWTKVGTMAYNMQIGVRNCAVSGGTRHCYPAVAAMLIDGTIDFSSVSCSSTSPKPGVSPQPGVSAVPGVSPAAKVSPKAEVSPKPAMSSKPGVSSAPRHHDDHPPPAPKHHDDAPKPSKGGGGGKHPDSTSSHKNTPSDTTSGSQNPGSPTSVTSMTSDSTTTTSQSSPSNDSGGTPSTPTTGGGGTTPTTGGGGTTPTTGGGGTTPTTGGGGTPTTGGGGTSPTTPGGTTSGSGGGTTSGSGGGTSSGGSSGGGGSSSVVGGVLKRKIPAKLNMKGLRSGY